MVRKRPKRLFFFGGDFGFPDVTVFRFHLSGDFTGGGRNELMSEEPETWFKGSPRTSRDNFRPPNHLAFSCQVGATLFRPALDVVLILSDLR